MAAMPMRIMVYIRGSDVVELVHASTFWAALNGTVAGSGEPDHDVRICGTASAAEILFVAEGLDDDWVVKGSCWGNVVSCWFVFETTVCDLVVWCSNGSRM